MANTPNLGLRKIDSKSELFNQAQNYEENFDKIDAHAGEINAQLAETENRINNIIVTPAEGITEQEILDARQGKGSLGDNITEVKSNVSDNAMFSGQVDFVELIKQRSNYKHLFVKKISVPYEALSIVAHDGNQHITHEWKKNPNDDYWLYHVAFGGLVQTKPDYLASTSEKIGTWSAVDGSGNIYTTQVGATFKVNIRGRRIQLNHMADSRGGLFSVVVDGDTANPVLVSVYNDVLVVKNTLIADGLDDVVHEVIGTFLGNDPAHTPSSTARGWIRDDQTSPVATDRYTMIGGVAFNGNYNSATNKMLLGYGSNKDWAFSITKNAETQWFPEHNGVGTAFKLAEPKLLVDNKEINFASMIAEQVIPGTDIKFIQSVKCLFPTILDPIANLDIIFNVGIDGVVALSGKLKLLQDCLINNGYTMMLPMADTVLNELLTSIGTHKVNSADNTAYNLTMEKDRAYSFASIDSRNPDLIGAVTIDYPLKTLRHGLSGRGNPFYFFQQRPTYPKVYPLVYFAHNGVVNETYNFNGRFAVGKIPNIYNYVK